MRTSDSLDIVIPAYKARFLPVLLQSLAHQRSKNFSVIVCDDASPEPLEPICQEFGERLPIRYVRFERNLGATDLAGHWNRSVALSHAPWVLLPGDDDALEENASSPSGAPSPPLMAHSTCTPSASGSSTNRTPSSGMA